MLSRRPQRIPSGGCTRASPTRRCDGGDSSACHSGRSPRRTGGRPRGRRRQLRHRRSDPPPFVEGVDELVDRQIAGRHPEYLGHWRWFAARRVKFGVFASADSFHVIVESGPPSSAGGSTPQRRPHILGPFFGLDVPAVDLGLVIGEDVAHLVFQLVVVDVHLEDERLAVLAAADLLNVGADEFVVEVVGRHLGHHLPVDGVLDLSKRLAARRVGCASDVADRLAPQLSIALSVSFSSTFS